MCFRAVWYVVNTSWFTLSCYDNDSGLQALYVWKSCLFEMSKWLGSGITSAFHSLCSSWIIFRCVQHKFRSLGMLLAITQCIPCSFRNAQHALRGWGSECIRRQENTFLAAHLTRVWQCPLKPNDKYPCINWSCMGAACLRREKGIRLHVVLLRTISL